MRLSASTCAALAVCIAGGACFARQVYRQFGPNPDEHSHDAIQNFRRRVLRELKKIKLAWPGLNYATGRGPLDPLSLDTRRSSGFGTSRIKSAKAPSWPLSGLSAALVRRVGLSVSWNVPRELGGESSIRSGRPRRDHRRRGYAPLWNQAEVSGASSGNCC